MMGLWGVPLYKPGALLKAWRNADVSEKIGTIGAVAFISSILLAAGFALEIIPYGQIQAWTFFCLFAGGGILSSGGGPGPGGMGSG